MVAPQIVSRVIELHYRARHRIDRGEIRPFVQIASVAGEGEIGLGVVLNVLLTDDMFYLKRCQTQ